MVIYSIPKEFQETTVLIHPREDDGVVLHTLNERTAFKKENEWKNTCEHLYSLNM